MRYDLETVGRVSSGSLAPTLRFFRFIVPTLTYGRLQRLEEVQKLAPSGWPLVRRPTGGGIVLHDEDLCLSLVWKNGQCPMPEKPSEHYHWIHTVIRDALSSQIVLSRVSCQDPLPESAPFHERRCFQEPVPCDLLLEGRKVVGGALGYQQGTVLYQGSIQVVRAPSLETPLQHAFVAALTDIR